MTALGLLAVFLMLGMAYVTAMSIAAERSDFDVRETRVRTMARGGVETAIGALQSALSQKKTADLLSSPIKYELPVYGIDRSAATGLSPQTNRKAQVTVTLSDESGKINVNHASPRSLELILGIDAAAAGKILSAVGGGASGGGWASSVDDLVSRGLAPAGANANFLTASSVADHRNARGFLNVNAAAPEVLGAVLDIDAATAQAVAARKPFAAIADLAAAAGKDPASLQAMAELSVESRCFRISSEAVLSNVAPRGGEYRIHRSRVEAVVVFGEDGTPRITHWNETSGRDADSNA